MGAFFNFLFKLKAKTNGRYTDPIRTLSCPVQLNLVQLVQCERCLSLTWSDKLPRRPTKLPVTWNYVLSVNATITLHWIPTTWIQKSPSTSHIPVPCTRSCEVGLLRTILTRVVLLLKHHWFGLLHIHYGHGVESREFKISGRAALKPPLNQRSRTERCFLIRLNNETKDAMPSFTEHQLTKLHNRDSSFLMPKISTEF